LNLEPREFVAVTIDDSESWTAQEILLWAT